MAQLRSRDYGSHQTEDSNRLPIPTTSWLRGTCVTMEIGSSLVRVPFDSDGWENGAR